VKSARKRKFKKKNLCHAMSAPLEENSSGFLLANLQLRKIVKQNHEGNQAIIFNRVNLDEEDTERRLDNLLATVGENQVIFHCAST
jgi:hypothetical protein